MSVGRLGLNEVLRRQVVQLWAALITGIILGLQLLAVLDHFTLGTLLRYMLVPAAVIALVWVILARADWRGVAGTWASWRSNRPSGVLVVVCGFIGAGGGYGIVWGLGRFDPTTALIIALACMGYVAALGLVLTHRPIYGIMLFLGILPLVSFIEWQYRPTLNADPLTIGPFLITPLIGGLWGLIFLSAVRNGLWKAGDPLRWPIVIFAVVILLLTLASGDPLSSARHYFPEVAYGLLFYGLALNAIRRREDSHILGHAVVASMSMLSLGNAYFYLTQRGINLENLALSRQQLNTGAFSSSIFAGELVLVIPLAIALAGMASRTSMRTLVRAELLLLIVALVLTVSRAEMIGAVIGVVTFALLAGRRKMHVAAAGALLLAVVWIIIPAVRTAWFTRGQEILAWWSGQFDVSIEERLASWGAAWQMFVDHPWTGIGLGQFADRYSDYGRTFWLARGTGHWIPSVPLFTHNVYLGYAAETGVFGVAAFVGLIFAILRSGARTIRVRRKTGEHLMAAGALGGITGFFAVWIVSGVGFALAVYIVPGLLLWVLVAITVREGEQFERRVDSHSPAVARR